MVVGILLASSFAGCESPPKPREREYTLYNPWPTVQTLAVAPAVNMSPSKDFDPLMVSDALFGEAQQVKGFTVLPVNKTLAAMERLGVHNIDSAQTAQNLVKLMGVDGLLVPVITAYDPYRPPVVGMTLQFYGSESARLAMVGTAQISPEVGGAVVKADPNEPQAMQITGVPLVEVATTTTAPKPLREVNHAGSEIFANREPIVQVSAVFNASNQTVLAELRDFARGRTNYESALQEDRFLADVDAYTRFVCHAMVRRLLELQQGTPSGR